MPLRVSLAWALAVLLAAPAVAAQSPSERALIEQGRTLRRAWRNAAALEASLQQVDRHLGSLRVESATPGATLTIDGRAVGALPMSEAVRVGEGAVVVEVRAPGHRDDRREVTIAAGETVRLVVQLAPQVEPGVAGVAPLAARPVEEPGVARRDVRPLPPRELPSSGGVTRALAWVSLGVAVASGGGGAVAMVLREGAAERWNDDARCLSGGRTREQNCGDERRTVATTHDLMVAGYVAGGVLAVGAAVLFLASPSRERAPEPRVSFGLGPGGVAVGGRF